MHPTILSVTCNKFNAYSKNQKLQVRFENKREEIQKSII